MNTTQIGNDFENRVYVLIKHLLDNDEFTVPGKRSRIYQKKGYKSEKRKNQIITDISIETFWPGATEYSILNVFECKCLNKNVVVDDIEEFSAKLLQIGEHGTKGTIVTTKGFSKDTINFAKSTKIGLLKVKSNNEFEWINYRKNSEPINFESDESEPFLALIENYVCNNVADLLLRLGVIDFYSHKDRFLFVRYLSVEKIASITDRILKYDVRTGDAVDTNKLIRFIQDRYPIVITSDNIYPLLGKITFDPLSIVVESSLPEHRYRFTLCHEIGHLVLHRNILEDRVRERRDDSFTLSSMHSLTDLNTRRIEIQANIFATFLLLPKESFTLEVVKFLIRNNISKNYIYLDKQNINRNLANTLILEISEKFLVSKEAARLRLIDSGFLKDTTKFSYRQIIENLKT